MSNTNKSNISINKKSIDLKYDIKINDKDLEINFKKSVSSINKLVIKDFK